MEVWSARARSVADGLLFARWLAARKAVLKTVAVALSRDMNLYDETEGRWLFLLPVDDTPKGRSERDGKCSLHLMDGRVGEFRCTGYDERSLRVEGVGTLE